MNGYSVRWGRFGHGAPPDMSNVPLFYHRAFALFFLNSLNLHKSMATLFERKC